MISREILEQLPNPHLTTELPADFAWSKDFDTVLSQSKQAQSFEWSKLGAPEKAAIAPLRAAHLRCAHLPADYDELAPAAQWMARSRTFRSWYDQRANVLVTNVDNLVASTYLFVESYLKPATCNRGKFYFRDPQHKYQMVRMAFSPARVETEPAKTLMMAPRGSTKTVTLFHQTALGMALTRPFTTIVLSESNGPRTGEEMQALQRQVEENDLIHADFGDKGHLWPGKRSSSYRWSDEQLDFCHLPGCQIRGRSFYAGMRGRHPQLWINDDPEDPKKLPTIERKREFFALLLQRGLPMLTHGNVCLWMTTRIAGAACDDAMRAEMLEIEDPDLRRQLQDARWDTWNRLNIDLIVEGPDGSLSSVFPDYLPVEGYLQKERTLGKRAAMAEYRGKAIAAGEFVLLRDYRRHAYMLYVEKAADGSSEVIYWDMKTAKKTPWKKFRQTLFIVSACDIAGSKQVDADYGCNVTIGVAPDGTIVVLDCDMRRISAEEWAQQSLLGSAVVWGTKIAAFEVGALQAVVARQAHKIAERLKGQGHEMPSVVPLKNPQTNKHLRVIAAIRPALNGDSIRFPCLEPAEDNDGITRVPVRLEHVDAFRLLYDQIDTYTDEGPAGHDDGPDALHMAIIAAGRRRGYEIEEEDPNITEMEAWKRLGVQWPRNMIPRQFWTPEMFDEERKERQPVMLSEVCDPYG